MSGKRIESACIYSAGKGNRLNMANTPKPLVYVGMKYLLQHTFDYLEDVGIKKIYLILGYSAPLIKIELIKSNLISENVEIIENIEWEKGILSSVMSLHNKVTGPFILLPCDLIFETNPYKKIANLKVKKDEIYCLIDKRLDADKISGASTKTFFEEDKIISSGLSIDKYNSFQTGVFAFGSNTLDNFKLLVKKHRGINFDEIISLNSRTCGLKAIFTQNKIWFDVNNPVLRLKADLFLRNYKRHLYSSRISSKPINKITPFCTFTSKSEVTTEVILDEKYVANIDSYQLIPRDIEASPHYLITDESVNRLYADRAFKKLKSNGYNIEKIVLPNGEQIKSLDYYSNVAEQIFRKGVDEHSVLISFGGGAINNLTGFLASTIYRGIRLIHIPTTLMAQCDAAIGIKQAINSDIAKNLLGTYYAPIKIIVDPSLLVSQNQRLLRDGLAECIKHALAQDPKFYEYLINYDGSINNLEFLTYIVKKNIELKVLLMKTDFHENNNALVLQYGHEFGHAIEFSSAYKLGHGESVSLGMIVSAHLARIQGIASDKLVEYHYNILNKYSLPTQISQDIKAKDISLSLRYNKKYRYERVQYALLKDLGQLWNYRGDFAIPCEQDHVDMAIQKAYNQFNSHLV